MGIQFARLELSKSRYVLKDGQLVSATGCSSELLDLFTQRAKAARIQLVGCVVGLPQLEEWSKKVAATVKPMPLVELKGNELRVLVLPSSGGRVTSVQDTKTGREYLRKLGDEKSGWNPFEGGIEQYASGAYRSAGFSESYSVMAQGSTFVELSAALANGLTLERRIELADNAAIRIVSRLINSGKSPVAGQLRLHPEFAVSSVVGVHVRAKNKEGWKKIEFADAKNPLAKNDIWVQPAELGGGQWVLNNIRDGWQATLHYNPAQIERGLLFYTGLEQFVTMELYSKNVTLEPGKSVELNCQLSFKKMPG